MKNRNFLSFLFLAIGVVGFDTSILAQKPTTPSTGGGNSSKPRPKDVSPIAVQRILEKVKLPAPPIRTKAIPKPIPKTEIEKVEPYKTPDIAETTWYVKEIGGEKWTIIFLFKSGGNCQVESYRLSAVAEIWTGTWRQLGDDVFTNVSRIGENGNTSPLTFTATIKNGTMNGIVSGSIMATVELQSDGIPNLMKMLSESYIIEQKEPENYDRRIDTYKKISLYFPQIHYVHYFLAEAYLGKKDSNNALIELSKAISFAPEKYERVQANKGECYRKRALIYYENLKDVKRAISDLESAYQYNLGGSDVADSQILASLYEMQNDYASAIRVCNREINNTNTERKARGYARRAKVHEIMGNTDLAIADISEAIKVDHADDRYVYYEDRAKLYEKKGDLIKAKEDYLQIATIFRTEPQWRFDQGMYYETVCRYYVLAGELDKAEPICNDKIHLSANGGDYDFYRSQGFWYFQKGKYEESLVDFTKLIELLGDEDLDSESLSLRAKAYRKLGKTELALADEKKAKTLEERDKVTSPF